MKNTSYYIKISKLISQEIGNNISIKDKKELEKWINSNSENQKLFDKLKDAKTLAEKIKLTEKIDKDKAWEKVKLSTIDKKASNRIVFLRVLKYAAIIAIPILLGVLIKFSFFNDNKKVIAENIIEQSVIKPGTQKAVLTLSDGTKIELDNNKTKEITTQNGTQILNTNNILEYFKDEELAEVNKLIFNTLQIPRGGEYSLVLSDGTKIWLNADTKLKYPIQFADSIREVFLEGEAYFEIAHNSQKPFIVSTNNMNINVLGTSFNVMAYNNENYIQTTLVTGKVKITDKSSVTETILKPGFQASLNKENHNIETKKVDTKLYTAWKDGKFIFDNENLYSIMKKLARWYDVEIIFENEEIKNYHFSGTLKKYDNISEILSMIELTTDVSFNILKSSVKISKK